MGTNGASCSQTPEIAMHFVILKPTSHTHAFEALEGAGAQLPGDYPRGNFVLSRLEYFARLNFDLS